MKIEETRYYRCPFCGAEFEEEGHAKNCMELHVSMDEIELAGTVGVLEGGRAYSQGTRLPEMVLIKGKTKDVQAYYKLHRATDSTITHIPTEKGQLELDGGKHGMDVTTQPQTGPVATDNQER